MKNSITPLAPDLKVSKVITGLWQVADLEREGKTLDPEEHARYLKAYAEAGLYTFDMADHYGSAELIAGTFRKRYDPDKNSPLLTKWVPKPGPGTKADVREAVERALNRLQSEHIDLLQFHAWYYPDPVWLDQLFWLQELKEEGLIRHLGLTNFDAAHLRMVCSSGIKVISNQISHSLLDRRASGEMARVCREFGVKVLAYGTLAGGFLSEKWLGKPEPDTTSGTWSQMKYKRFIDQAGGWDKLQQLLTTLQPIAEEHGVSIANVAVKYIMEKDFVGAVIIGARLGQSEHINDTLKLFDFSLSQEDQRALEETLERLPLISGDCGDEYRKPPFLTASGDLSHHLDQIPRPYTPILQENERSKVLSGTSWESMAGYARAVRKGPLISVSGTTATHRDKVIGGTDPEAQAHFVLDKLEAAIVSLGGKLEDVIRTRIFVHRLEDWEAVARAHGQRFGHIQPANTLVEAKLVGDAYLVEMEADAWVSET